MFEVFPAKFYNAVFKKWVKNIIRRQYSLSTNNILIQGRVTQRCLDQLEYNVTEKNMMGGSSLDADDVKRDMFM